jgi:predicted Rossmann fold flavoprotein
MLLRQMSDAGVDLRLATAIRDVSKDGKFSVVTDKEVLKADSLVVATGGKSIPKMGATGFGYQLAGRFGVAVTETRPGLVPLTFAEQELEAMRPLAGVSVEARVNVGRVSFEEGLLFTHRGLSGPSILQASSYWREGETLVIDLARGQDLVAALKAARDENGRVAVQTALARHLPGKVAGLLLDRAGISGRLADQSNQMLERIGNETHRWQVKPVGSEGYRTAEVTLGGIDTDALSSQTMEVKAAPGLYFIGEVVDVTGWLGGYNFQWAWSSGWAAGQVA